VDRRDFTSEECSDSMEVLCLAKNYALNEVLMNEI